MRLPRFLRLPLSFLVVLALVVPARAQTEVAARLQSDINNLSRFPSRVPGTPGNRAAADYVRERFNALKLQQVRVDEYLVTAPVTKEASLTVGGRNLEVFPVYPNQVVASTTPPAGLGGPLVYAKAGNLADFNGQKVDGSIVALDFDSGMNWINAVDLGAKAIIFLESPNINRGEAERKFTFLPVEVPRFYVRGAAAQTVRASKGQAALVKSLVIWEQTRVRNVLGFLPGKSAPGKNKPNTIVVNAYYDSMSVVPDLAPGAEGAGNMAAMLEMARRFQANPPSYNVLFVANGAHHLALAGVRNFIAKHVVDRDGKATEAQKAEMASYRGFINLDLTSRTRTVGLFAKSWFYNQMTVGSEAILLNQFNGLAKALGRFSVDEAKRTNRPVEDLFVDGVTGANGRTWRSYLPSLVALDSEAATMAALPGISFATANDARLLQDTPADTPDRLNMANLVSQVESTEKLMRESFSVIAQGDTKSTPVIPATATLSKNFGYLIGRAIYRDVEQASSFLPDSPLPDEQLLDPTSKKSVEDNKGVQAVGVVVSSRSGTPLEQKSYAGVRGLMIERATYSKPKKGASRVTQFVFTGPRVGDSKGGGNPNYELEAFSIDRNGHIIFAPDMGSERQRFSPSFSKATLPFTYKDEKLQQLDVQVSLICFPARATTIFDTLDQRYFSVLSEMTVLDARTDASPVEYGYLKPAVGPGSAEIEPIAMVFSKPDARFKLIMAAGLLGKRLVLLRTVQNEAGAPASAAYEGTGFEVQNTSGSNRVRHVAYQTALDLWTLDQQRIRLLKGFGINNQRVDELHGNAGCPVDAKAPPNPDGTVSYACPTESISQPTGGSLALAATALNGQQYDTFYREARRAFGLESRAYPDVEATSQDVLKGIIFYLALLLPFAYFVERMLFGFPDVRKQIAGTSLVFLAVFVAIRFVHPAFELALTPFIILLAFVILALTVIVTMFLQSKFEQEIKRMKQGVHYADLGRLSALGASLGLGIANMRRRPTRTALTCTTLILLTFTVLSFTSVKAKVNNFARPYGSSEQAPAYQGFLVRQADWSAMPEVAVRSISNEITAQKLGEPALRAWYLSRDQGEPLQLRVNNSADPNKFYYAPALVGLTPQEETIGSPVAGTILPGGRWFRAGETDKAIVPRDVLLDEAQRKAENTDAAAKAATTPVAADATAETTETGPPLGLTLENAVGSSIQVGGKNFEIIGIFDDRKWYSQTATNNIRDLDNEEFSPVDYGSDQTRQNASANSNAQQQGKDVQVQSYQHMRANALLLLPYDTAIDMGATTRSMAIGIKDPKVAQGELNDLMQRAALGIFGATPDAGSGGKLTSKLYSSVEGTSYEGFASLAVPVLIAALIIANTMLGSVYERTREIGIYSSIGLAPVHVAALFIAEALVYAVLGSISGYLIAQIVAKIITATNLLPGITLNYSSSSAVLATLIVMATVMLSTLYPAWAASKLSNPDARKSELGDPVGDLWRLQFPFTVSGLQSLGMAQFLADYFNSHTDTSVGKFYTDKIHFTSLPLHEAVALLNEGVPNPADEVDGEANGSSTNGHANGATNGSSTKALARKKTPLSKMPKIDETASGQSTPPVVAPKGGYLALDSIAADPNTEVYRLSLRTWLAPFDMGVSQDTDIILLPASEPGLYELQLRLERRSGEIAAWKRVNAGFMTELRKQLLVWRTIKPEAQQEYILTGRATVTGARVPVEAPGAVVA